MKAPKHNLTKDQHLQLQELRNDTSIIIKEADKGGGIVIMNTDYYVIKIMDMLSNTSTYEKSNANVEKKTMRELKQLIQKNAQGLTDQEIDYLTKFEFSQSNFYGLPKIHKSKTIQDEVRKQKSDYILTRQPDDLKFRPI